MPPLWRQLYDSVERTVARPLESLVRTERFARGAAVAGWARSMAREQATELSARLWHLVNLPAGTDVARLRARIGALDREVRRLSVQLERAAERHGGEQPGRPARVDRYVERAEHAEHNRTHAEESADAVAARADRPRPPQPGEPDAPRDGAQRPAGP
jgi:hypothetical protein